MSEPEDNLQDAKITAEVVGELIRSAGDSSEGQQAARNIGQTAVTITEAINNALLPITVVNFTIAKAREYFTNSFPIEIAQKVSEIKPENIKEPDLSIAGPAISALAFSHEENHIREILLNLIKSSMGVDTSETTHPAFVEIAKQMTGEDVLTLATLHRERLPVASIEVLSKREDGAGITLREHLTAFTLPFTAHSYIRAMAVENLARLKLISTSYSTNFVDESRYQWVEVNPEYQRLKKQTTHAEGYDIGFKKGIISNTDFGQQFSIATDLYSIDLEVVDEA